MHPRSRTSPSQDAYKHPLESLLEAIGRDPSLATERRQIQEYVERSLRVKATAEPGRKDLAVARLDTLISEARDEVNTTYLLGSISERDKDWLQTATPLLQVLATLPDSHATGMRSNLVRALIIGAYARLAPEALIDDIAKARLQKTGPTATAHRRRRKIPVRRGGHGDRASAHPTSVPSAPPHPPSRSPAHSG